MQRLGLINDENFARHRAKYLADQNRSPREIRRRLAEKGIDRDAVDTALAELAPDETQACRALIEKNYGRRLREPLCVVCRGTAPHGFFYRPR